MGIKLRHGFHHRTDRRPVAGGDQVLELVAVLHVLFTPFLITVEPFVL